MLKLKNKLGVEPSEITHFAEAMTHGSCEGKQNNRKLAFLGDAVLGLAVSQYILERDALITVGDMTEKRAFVVNSHFLFLKAIDWQLNSFIRLGKGERQTGGETKENILAECVEALIGAIFLDSGYEKAREFVEKNIIPKRIEIDDWNFKGRLQEFALSEGMGLPKYITKKKSDEEHSVFFTTEVSVNGKILAQGYGRSKRIAEQLAAKDAIEEISRQDIKK